ncbi:hypothetical protein COL65_06445 [Priestia aryabhattai]|uniref:Uncharacterized protein n=2 Tax=Priestia TaxID=2800373 RepID=A0A8D4BNK1_PRIMW|nr:MULTISPECIES: hypothetical protein [Priestia]AEN89718.1 hypothetical protein BMWSH_2836 [Priestia megaterium WSH-002]MED5244613.1 hypothetical protein [Priestia sp. LL-8]PGA20579.1 hypothetical protein COL65_06445 [Priestia aryabhattai]QDZ80504.1 hypothetical protein D0440_13995 [Priestia megaterium]
MMKTEVYEGRRKMINLLIGCILLALGVYFMFKFLFYSPSKKKKAQQNTNKLSDEASASSNTSDSNGIR